MQAAGMECDFVGHPIATQPIATVEEVHEFRVQSGIGDAPILLVLPGSRSGEVARLAPVFGPVLRDPPPPPPPPARPPPRAALRPARRRPCGPHWWRN